MIAITEGGLHFPLSKLVRQLLYYFDLAPNQVVVNVYRVLCTILRLAERHGILVTVYDVMGIYSMTQHKTYKTYFFTIRAEYDHLITDLYDSKKWQNNFVVIRGNFMWKPDDPKDWLAP